MDKEIKNYLEEKFEVIDQKFESAAATQNEILTLVDRRFDAVDQRFDKVESRLDNIEDKLDSVVNQVSGHEKRIAFLEDKTLD